MPLGDDLPAALDLFVDASPTAEPAASCRPTRRCSNSEARSPSAAPPANSGSSRRRPADHRLRVRRIEMMVDGLLSGMSFDTDVRYGMGDGTPLLLDMVKPDPLPAEPMPAVVWVHGGGWRSGDKHVDSTESIGLDFRPRWLHLSEHQLPAQRRSAFSGPNSRRQSGDPLAARQRRRSRRRSGAHRRLGDSAGAHLVSLLGPAAMCPRLRARVVLRVFQAASRRWSPFRRRPTFAQFRRTGRMKNRSSQPPNWSAGRLSNTLIWCGSRTRSPSSVPTRRRF